MSYPRTAADVIAALLHKPRTAHDIAEFAGVAPETVYACLKQLHEAGVVYRSGSIEPKSSRDGDKRTGRCPVIWAMQTKPFAEVDRVNKFGAPA